MPFLFQPNPQACLPLAVPKHPCLGSISDSLLVSVWITPIETKDGRTSQIAPKLRRTGKMLHWATAELTLTAI